MKYLFCFLFIARVLIPTQSRIIDNIKNFDYASQDGIYRLFLTNGKTVYVPIMWTIIEEK